MPLTDDVELQETTKYLEEERSRADELHNTVQTLEAEARISAEKITRLTASEKSLTDKTRDQASPPYQIPKVHLRRLTSISRNVNCTKLIPL